MAEAGWHQDPTGRHEVRYFDGATWTDHVADNGVTATDPLTPAPAPFGPVPGSVPQGAAQYPGATAIAGGVVPAGTHLASPWLRLGSYLLDAVLAVVTLGIGWLIWAIVVWGEGKSPAKKILGLRVVKKATGATFGRGDMFVRDIVLRVVIQILSLFTAGNLGIVSVLMIFSTYHETMWDKWAGSLVVAER